LTGSDPGSIVEPMKTMACFAVFLTLGFCATNARAASGSAPASTSVSQTDKSGEGESDVSSARSAAKEDQAQLKVLRAQERVAIDGIVKDKTMSKNEKRAAIKKIRRSCLDKAKVLLMKERIDRQNSRDEIFAN
jgi:hypothetical protein